MNPISAAEREGKQATLGFLNSTPASVQYVDSTALTNLHILNYNLRTWFIIIQYKILPFLILIFGCILGSFDFIPIRQSNFRFIRKNGFCFCAYGS